MEHCDTAESKKVKLPCVATTSRNRPLWFITMNIKVRGQIIFILLDLVAILYIVTRKDLKDIQLGSSKLQNHVCDIVCIKIIIKFMDLCVYENA